MASTLSLSLSINPKPHNLHIHNHSTLKLQTQTLLFAQNPKPRPTRHVFKPFSSSSPSSPATEEPPILSYVSDPLRNGRFLSSDELASLQLLDGFAFAAELESGSLLVRAMREEETDSTVALLAESFIESMVLPKAYNSLIRFLVKQYLVERRAVIPHAVTLLGFFRERKDNSEDGDDGDEDEMELAGTVEVCFDKRGVNSSPPTPTAPRDSPYISNMTVKYELRRRGIGWHLLKASEELISQMTSSSEAYLHCRIIDTAPFNMYTKSGYNVVKTDNFLILLTLQRRKHLMCKKLPIRKSSLESDTSDSDED